MKHLLIALMALVVVSPAGYAADDTKGNAKPAKPATAAEKYKALVKEYDTATKDFRESIEKAKTDEERRKAFEEKYPKREKYSAAMLKLAEENPKDSAAVDALVWILSNYGPEADKACELLVEHSQDERLAAVLENLRYTPSPAVEKLLRAVLEKNPERTAKGRACFALASMNQDKKSKEAEEFRNRVLKEFADVTKVGGATLADAINAPQFEKEHLAIGKAVPDIAGEDIDGKKFKLSDYRGKVVLLDFWGNW